jgi:hypothetical protein
MRQIARPADLERRDLETGVGRALEALGELVRRPRQVLEERQQLRPRRPQRRVRERRRRA